ncbi:MAG TPA: hypothetical protein VN456_00855 [Desulfosporosinus sp.]|nr:hypothetical protein [Desulfosporosinus sp.]
MTVYGKQQDVLANQGRGVNLYIPGKTILKEGDVFLGGTGTGVTDQEINGATRVFGKTAEDTASAYGGYLKGSQSQAKQPALQPSFKLPPGARPTLAMRSQIASEDQWGKDFNYRQQQDAFDNEIKASNYTGNYQGADTLQQKTFDWGKAMDEANQKIKIGDMMGTYEGRDTWVKQAQAIQQANLERQMAVSQAKSSGGSSRGSSSGSSKVITQSSLEGKINTDDALAEIDNQLQLGTSPGNVAYAIEQQRADLTKRGVNVNILIKHLWSGLETTPGEL